MDTNEIMDKCIDYLPMPEIPLEVWAAIAESQKKAEESTGVSDVSISSGPGDSPDDAPDVDDTEIRKALANVDKESLNKAIAEFQESFKERSFSQRHKELGKMIKCQVCRTRHRASQVCEQRFARVRVCGDPDNLRQTEPVNSKPRLGIGPRNRMSPHFSKRRILLVQRVKEFIEAMPGSENFATEVRDLMLSRMKKTWRQRRNALQRVQKESRTINRSL